MPWRQRLGLETKLDAFKVRVEWPNNKQTWHFSIGQSEKTRMEAEKWHCQDLSAQNDKTSLENMSSNFLGLPHSTLRRNATIDFYLAASTSFALFVK